jgi:beta-1,4-N-acetylglucosaminyltransferase
MTLVLDPAETKNWRFRDGEGMKVCFVTTGATAPFTALIKAVLEPKSLETLLSQGYTHLLVQYGTAKDVFTQELPTAEDIGIDDEPERFTIGGMDFDGGKGLDEQFRLVQQSNGMVISHAGW